MLSIDYTKDLLNLQGVIVDKTVLPKAVTTKLKCLNEMPTVIEISNDFATEYCICLKRKKRKKRLLNTATQFLLTFLTPTIDKEPINLERLLFLRLLCKDNSFGLLNVNRYS